MQSRPEAVRAQIAVAADGTIAPPDGPGLGVAPDLSALEAYRTA
mgnify:CR=1 FL=1